MKVAGRNYRAVWMEGGRVRAVNQPLLPHKFEVISFRDHRQTAEAIRTMVVRGAGTIGAAAGFALAQACLEAPPDCFRKYIADAYARILKTRPTAADLKHALDRVMAAIKSVAAGDDRGSRSPAEGEARREVWRQRERLQEIRQAAVAEAQAIADDYVAAMEKIGEFGERLIKPRSVAAGADRGSRSPAEGEARREVWRQRERLQPCADDTAQILTHCNAGWLALVDWGSASAPIYSAHRHGKKVFVFVDETRPRNQGANLTSWEFLQEKIPHAIIADNAAGFFMKRGEVDLVITGADRIAANGDVANKIGTYEKAVLARENGIPFYVAAPTSTIDLKCPGGDHIPIEERSEDEVHYITGAVAAGDDRGSSSTIKAGIRAQRARLQQIRVTPAGARARNPAFDVTPARYITAIITERGIAKPNRRAIASLFK